MSEDLKSALRQARERLIEIGNKYQHPWDDVDVAVREIDAALGCPGCGSNKPLSYYQERGKIACCPDRPGASSFIEFNP